MAEFDNYMRIIWGIWLLLAPQDLLGTPGRHPLAGTPGRHLGTLADTPGTQNPLNTAVYKRGPFTK